MNKFETMAAEYNDKVGHDRNFLCVQDDNGTIRLVVNNSLMAVDNYSDIVKGVDGATIMSYVLLDEDTVDARLENLAVSAVKRGIKMQIVVNTAGAIVAQQGIDPHSPEGSELVNSVPERIAKQPNAEEYMLLSLLGM